MLYYGVTKKKIDTENKPTKATFVKCNMTTKYRLSIPEIK